MFVGSVEFYVIAFVTTIVVVGILMRPSAKKEGRIVFACGEIVPASGIDDVVAIAGEGDGCLRFVHKSVRVPARNCEVNYSIAREGRNIKIVEKRVGGAGMSPEMLADVYFSIDGVPLGRYRVFFDAPWCGKWAIGTIAMPLRGQKILALQM
mgnify:FL=1